MRGADACPSAKTCHARRDSGPQRNACLSDEAICAGLAPEGVLVYVERCEDAQIDRLKGGVPLPRILPYADKVAQDGGSIVKSAWWVKCDGSPPWGRC